MGLNKFLKTLGPGILFASTAIGVSHLVQSTRAGAGFGFALLWAVVLANLLKFPFFEYGSRYANVTGKSLIDGYERTGKWMLWLYALITIGSMFFVTAAVGAVTAGFMDNLFGLSGLFPKFSLFPAFLVFTICFIILAVGRFNLLDSLIKIIGVVLLVSTVAAFIIALFKGKQGTVPFSEAPGVWDLATLPFIIALMGWMPTAVDLSTWNSLWTLERIKQSGYKPSLKETLNEFNLGYWVSAGLGICFLTLGAYMIFGTGIQMPDAGVPFANRVISLYTETIGPWSYYIIAAAGFSIMFGTLIGVFDGYSRALERTGELLFNTKGSITADKRAYLIALCVTALGGFFIIWKLGGSLKKLVDIATTISFLIAPVVAAVNFYLVTKSDFAREGRPKTFMRILSWLGLIFLTGFSLFYLWFKFLS